MACARVALRAAGYSPTNMVIVQHLRQWTNNRSDADAPGGTEWPTLRSCYYTPRLALAWAFILAVLLFTDFWLLYFVAVAFDEQLELQSKEAGEYLEGLLSAYAISFCQSVLLQESVKVVVISLISPQMLPDASTLRVAPRREAMRLAMRGVLSAVYGTVIMLF